MKTHRDDKLMGWAMVFDGALEVIDAAERGKGRIARPDDWGYNLFSGKSAPKVETWVDVRKAFLSPEPELVETVKAMLEELRQEIAPPKSRLRKAFWSESAGEVDCNRAMRGESDYMRDYKRDYRHGPEHIALLCNLDAVANDSPQKVFWRGAGACAASDLLEAAGYTVEVWLWCLGSSVFRSPYGGQFSTFIIKEAGAPLDVANFVSTLSANFLRCCLFGSFAGCGLPCRDCGGARYHLGEWRKYMRVTENVTELAMPVVFDRDSALQAARDLLAKVQPDNASDKSPVRISQPSLDF